MSKGWKRFWLWLPLILCCCCILWIRLYEGPVRVVEVAEIVGEMALSSEDVEERKGRWGDGWIMKLWEELGLDGQLMSLISEEFVTAVQDMAYGKVQVSQCDGLTIIQLMGSKAGQDVQEDVWWRTNGVNMTIVRLDEPPRVRSG